MTLISVTFGKVTLSLNEIFSSEHFSPWTSQPLLIDWIVKNIDLCKPSHVHFCDGSLEEYDNICDMLVKRGVFTPLNPAKRPHSYACSSDPSDVARVEESTFICSLQKEEAGPTNNWKDPKEMKEILLNLFNGCMQGRTLYVVPFCMGPLSSEFSLVGVEITDSPYVVCNMKIMTRMGKEALEKIGQKGSFLPCLHSVGKPLAPEENDVVWPCNSQKYIVHFPEERSVWSFGSGYGGNALLGKKSIALRIASSMAKEQGWLAEHMLIIGITNPDGQKKYIAAAFPSQCGKTNLALLSPKLPGWKVECIGDDIAWMRVGKDGRLYAVNPEAGFFGVAPGTSYETNPHAMQTICKDAIFTNVALTKDKDVWWEGMTREIPDSLIDWQGNSYDPNSDKKAAHPNARFTVSLTNCPILDEAWNDPQGVPISAILFGGRRSSVAPLVCEARSWSHGVLMGAAISSETTAAATGTIGKLRHDPFAMLPFCGYHMGDYFAHWISMGQKIKRHPKVFYVNWFRKDASNRFIWPGFKENMRVLKWVFERTENKEVFQELPIGHIPSEKAFDVSGLLEVEFGSLFSYSAKDWIDEVEEMEKYFSLFTPRIPTALTDELKDLKKRILSDA